MGAVGVGGENGRAGGVQPVTQQIGGLVRQGLHLDFGQRHARGGGDRHGVGGYPTARTGHRVGERLTEILLARAVALCALRQRDRGGQRGQIGAVRHNGVNLFIDLVDAAGLAVDRKTGDRRLHVLNVDVMLVGEQIVAVKIGMQSVAADQCGFLALGQLVEIGQETAHLRRHLALDRRDLVVDNIRFGAPVARGEIAGGRGAEDHRGADRLVGRDQLFQVALVILRAVGFPVGHQLVPALAADALFRVVGAQRQQYNIRLEVQALLILRMIDIRAGSWIIAVFFKAVLLGGGAVDTEMTDLVAVAQKFFQLLRIHLLRGQAVADTGDLHAGQLVHRYGVRAGGTVCAGDGVGHRFREILCSGGGVACARLQRQSGGQRGDVGARGQSQ